MVFSLIWVDKRYDFQTKKFAYYNYKIFSNFKLGH